MATASANEVGLYYDEESTWNETPAAPKLIPIRYVSEDLATDKLVRMSESIRYDRQRLHAIQTGEAAVGSVTCELALDEYHDLIGAALMSSGTVVNVTTLADCTISAAAKTIVSTATDFAAAGVAAGMWIRVAGSARSANNATWRVVSCVTVTITVEDPYGVLEDAFFDTLTVTGRMYRNGTTAKSFMLEKQFTDISRFEQIHGARVAGMSLDLSANEIARIVFRFEAARAEIAAATVGDGTPYAYAETVPIDGSSGIVSIECGGSISGVRTWLPATARKVTLDIENNARRLLELGTVPPAEIGLGWQDYSGVIDCYFSEATLLTKLLTHTETVLRVTLADSAGSRMIVTLPRIVLTGETPAAGGGNQDVALPLRYAALRDATLGYTAQIDIV